MEHLIKKLELITIKDDLQETIEHLIEKLEFIKMKDDLLFEYVDKHIDEWGIDIGDNYLDDIMEQVCQLRKKRLKLSEKSSKDDDIVFKEDDETIEKQQLKTVEKKYDKLYEDACGIKIENYEDEDDGEGKSLSPSSSWKVVLTKIDMLENRFNTKTDTI